MRWVRRSFACALAAAAAFLSPAPAAAAPWTASDDDALLFDARIGQLRIGDGIRGYQTSSGICLDLADTLATLDVPIAIDAVAGIADGWAFEERNRIRIDRRAGKVRLGERQLALEAEAIHDTPEGWCASAAALSRWFGIELKPDLANALLLVSSRSKLPVQLAAERRARAARVRAPAKIDLARLPQARLDYEMWRMPSVDAVVTFTAVSDRQRGEEIARRFEVFASGEAAFLSVDARLSSDDRGAPTDLRVRGYRTDPDAGLLGPLRATHFAIGDVSSFGSALAAQSVIGRGAIVTNRPIGLADTFDRKTFRGELPAGWDAELYRNGQLLEVAQNRSDGRYEFIDVPLLYGQNRFEIVLYGPQGQIRRETETVTVGPDSIPPRETWYWAGVTQDERDVLTLARSAAAQGRGWRGGVGVERGLDERTSVAAQAHSLVIDGRRRSFLEASLRRSIGPALFEFAGSADDRGGVALRGQLLGQFGETYISAESILARDYVSDRVEAGRTGRHLVAIDHAFDLGKFVLPVHAEARYTTRADGGGELQGGVRVSATIKRFSVTAAVDLRRQRGGYGPASQDMGASLLANGMVGRTQLRGELRWRLSPGGRFESASLVAQRPIGPATDLRAEIGYDRGLDRGRAALGYVRRFKQFALTASAEAATDGSLAAGLNLAFSIGPDPRRGGLRVAPERLAATGSALARVFHDLNGDGIRQAGEGPAKDVQLLVDRTATASATDAQGELLIDGLEPHRPLLVGINASSLPDPMMQPGGPGVAVTPRPGVAVAFDLPLVSAGDVIGTLVAAGGRPLEGVDLELVDSRGLVAAQTRSDFDGYFGFERVPYGSYRLRIAAASAAASRLAADLRRTATIGAKAPVASLGTIAADPEILAARSR